MKTRICIVLGALLLTQTVKGQVDSLLYLLEDFPQLQISGFSYPTFLNGETHSQFTINYPVNMNFDIELQGFFDTYPTADIMRYGLRGKYRVDNRTYLFSGTAIDLEIDGLTGAPLPPSYFVSNGVGHDLRENLNLELKHELQLNPSEESVNGYNIPSLFTVNGKFKF